MSHLDWKDRPDGGAAAVIGSGGCYVVRPCTVECDSDFWEWLGPAGIPHDCDSLEEGKRRCQEDLEGLY